MTLTSEVNSLAGGSSAPEGRQDPGPTPGGTRKREKFARLTAMVVSIGLLTMGAIGLFWDIEAQSEASNWSSAGSVDDPFGVLPASQWAHALHMLLGGAGFVVVFFRRAEAARRYVLLAGVVLLVWALTRFIFEDPVAAALSGWAYPGWIHLGAAVVVTAVGFVLRSRRPRRSLATTEEVSEG